MKKRARILALSRFYHPEEMEGVAEFAREAGWALRFIVASRQSLPEHQNFDGVILIHTYRDDQMTEFVNSLKNVPIVTLGRHFWPDIDSFRVGIDVNETGKIGANYFIANGFDNIGFISMDRGTGSQLPEYISYKEAVEKAGRRFVEIRAENLREDLKIAPKPLGLMTYDDEWSVRVYNDCEEMGINVPEEVALLGTANVKHLCELNYVRLSSLDTKTDLCGYKAAQILEKMMNGTEFTERETLVKPGRVIVRESTEIPPIADIRVAKAVKLILERFRETIDVAELAEEIGLSRWGLDEAFKRSLNLTVSAFQLQCRIKEAEKMLEESDLPINEIGRHIGYENHVSFLRAFKRVKKCSPSQFRRNSQ